MEDEKTKKRAGVPVVHRRPRHSLDEWCQGPGMRGRTDSVKAQWMEETCWPMRPRAWTRGDFEWLLGLIQFVGMILPLIAMGREGKFSIVQIKVELSVLRPHMERHSKTCADLAMLWWTHVWCTPGTTPSADDSRELGVKPGRNSERDHL